jgi:sugar phosphate isomerase/epimerase
MVSPQIHVPFDQIDRRMDFILAGKFNLEIYFGSDVLDSLDDNHLRKIRDTLDYGPSLTLHAPFLDLSPGAVDSLVRSVTIKRFMQTLHVAEILNPRSVVFHSGYEKWKYALDVNFWLERSLETWRPLNERFLKAGYKIAIENIFEDEPTNLKLLMEAMASDNFGICFDTGHCNMFTSVPLDRWIDELGPYIIELHLHDNDKSADQHFPPGDGSFDFDRLFSRLNKKDIIYTLEAHTPEHALIGIERLKKYLG